MTAAWALLWSLSLPGAVAPEGCDVDWLDQPTTYAFDYAVDIQSIWDTYCANCHVQHAGTASAALDLDPPYSYASLLQAPSSQDPSILLVAPFDPDASLLWRKVNCDMPGPYGYGERMPLERPKLPAALRARLFDWIAAGAPLQLERVFFSGFEN